MSKSRIFTSLIAFFLLLAGVAWAESPSNIGGMRQDEKNEVKIRALYDEFESAWNRHDVQALVALWTIDGDHVEPDGTEADGKDAIAGLLAKQHGSVFKTSMLDLSIADVWFVKTGVALVDGTYTLGGAKLPDGKDLPSRTGRYTAVLLDEQSHGWQVAASRLMIPTELPYKPE